MKVTVEEVNAVQKRLKVELPAEDVTKELDKVYQGLKKNAQIKGFRPGKAPRSVLERYYGPQAENEAMSQLIGKAYPEALENEGIEAVAEPEIERANIAEDKTLQFEALVPIRPAVVPKGYKDIEVERKKPNATDEQVEAEIERMREQQAEMVPVEEVRPLVKGDYADIDFEGFVDGKPIQGGKADGFLLELGSQSFIPGFEEQVEGMTPGDSGEITVTFPEQYQQKALAGKEATFKVTVNGIKKREVPALDDVFAKTVEGAEASTADELKEFVKRKLIEADEQQAGQEMRRMLAEKMVDANVFEVPR